MAGGMLGASGQWPVASGRQVERMGVPETDRRCTNEWPRTGFRPPAALATGHWRLATNDSAMPEALRVLHVASEMAPLVKTGGLADVAGALPAALKRAGIDT